MVILYNFTTIQQFRILLLTNSMNRLFSSSVYVNCLQNGVLLQLLRIVPVGFFLLFIPVFLRSQPANYIIQHFTSENGLPQNSVKGIQFDKNGFCWLSTEAGVVRFDNKDFKSFGYDNITGLKSERIYVMGTDLQGDVYAQNINSQDLLMSVSSSIMATTPVMYHNKYYSYPSIGYRTPNKLFDSLWDALKHRMKHPEFKDAASLKNEDIYLTFEDSLYFINGNKLSRFVERKGLAIANMPVGADIFLQIWKNNEIKVWYHGNLLDINKLEGDITNANDLMSGHFTVLWCPTGTFLYAGRNLYEITKKGNKIYGNIVLKNIDIPTPLSIYYRPDLSTFYIGSATQGLFIIKIPDVNYPEIPEASGLPNFYAISKTSDDKIIAKNVVIPTDNKPYYVPLDNENCIATYVDSADQMYYEREFELCRFNSKTNRITRLLALDDRLTSILPEPTLGGLILATYKSIYLITTNGEIIWRKKIPQGDRNSGMQPIGVNSYLLLTAKGLKWYNTVENRISKTILDSFYIRSVCKDRLGRLWISTDGNGAYLYQNNKLYQLPMGPSKSLKTIHSFIDDGNGFFWLPTNNGLFKVSIRELSDYVTGKSDIIYFYILNSRNGLRTNEFNGGANPVFQWLKDSTLVLPSLNGIVELKPMSLSVFYPENKIFIDQIIVDRKDIIIESTQQIIDLKPSFNLLTIKVTCPYFGNIENLQLEFSINSGSNQWLPVPASGLITINTLPPDDYKIIIRKAGYRNGEIIIQVTVLPEFYNTWWFYTLSILSAATIIYILVKRRVAFLIKENQKIEKLVQLRTRELNQTVGKLEDSENALQHSNRIKEQVIAMVLHDLRSPIRFLSTISDHLVKNVKNYSIPVLSEYLEKLHQSIGTLKDFTELFFSWAVTQQNDFKVKPTAFPLQEIFENIRLLYAEIIASNNNVLEVLNTGIVCNTDYNILSMVLRNIVDNANKNTNDGIITISALSDDSQIFIYVKDNGSGLSQEEVDHFTDASKGITELGAGSTIVLNMLHKINGTLSIKTAVGEGSIFVVVIGKYLG